jgi:hypothetical protein
MDLNQLKEQWKRLDANDLGVDQIHNAIVSGRRYKRAATIAARLSRRHLCLAILSALAPMLLLPLSASIDVPLAFGALYTGYFLIMIGFNLSLSKTARQLQLADVPVRDALIATTCYAVAYRRLNIIGLALALPLVVYLLMVLQAAGIRAAVVGGWIGLAVGVVAGVALEWRVRVDIRALRQALREDLD